MSKKCEIKPYIQNITSDIKEQTRLNNIHNDIFDELKSSEFYSKEVHPGMLFEKSVNHLKDYNGGRHLVNTINGKYGKEVVGWNNSKPTNKRYLFVNVKNLLNKDPNQTTLFQTKSESTVSKKNIKLEQAMKEFAQINGVKVEFIPSLIEKFGGDHTAAYDSVNKIIYINEGKAGLDTFPEEVGHVLTLALGSEHTLVKKAFNLLSRTDFKKDLDPAYVALYKNNEDALKHEVVGKMIAKVLVKQYEPKTQEEFKLFHSLLQLIDKFISMFKRNDRLEDTIKDLASKITNKEVVAFSEVSGPNSVYFQTEPSKSKLDDKLKEQYVYLKQQHTKDVAKLKDMDPDSADFDLLDKKIIKTKSKLEELQATGNKAIIIELGNEMLDNLEIMLNNVEDVDIKLKLNRVTIAAAETTFTKLGKVSALSKRAMDLEARLQPLIEDFTMSEIDKRATEGRKITKKEVFGKGKDISKLTRWFGKLSNSPNYIARTIHQMIKEVQNKVSALNKSTLKVIKEEVEALRTWSKDNGISESDMYNVFIQKQKGTTVLTRMFTEEFYAEMNAANKLPKDEALNAKNRIAKYDPILKWLPRDKKYINENYTKIQNTPALKKFYDFHVKLINEAASKLPVKLDPEFIANISTNTILDALKSDAKSKEERLLEIASNMTGINIKQFKDGTFVADEGLFQDVIPLKFIASLDANKKSTNLGDNLAKFVNFANNYEEMSDILPTIRSMQSRLGKQEFVKSSDPTTAILGKDTNIYEFIDTVIDMQVMGNMKLDEKKISLGTYIDEDGKEVEKYTYASKIADFGMKYNSLLRIGLNPINALTNLLIGDIGNIIEGFGNRFYSLTNLKDASNIFFRDAMKEDSDLNHWRDKIGPLQELEDHETVEQVSTGKTITKEKIEEVMYYPQKIGETWLQNRTMIAILLKDGYMDSNGNTTPKGKNISDTDLQRLINKCYEVNNKIHGRYSSRDAAAISQQVIPRMMMQFKKWIPAAIESRFEAKHFNVDLGVEVEGRYKTGFRLMVKALKGDLKALQSGNMTELEIYNMRKNLAEVIIAMGSMLMFMAMGGFGDDDEELKKNPYYKFTMDQLDRVSGDMLYFYNPGSYTETALKPIALMKTTNDVIMCVVAFPHILGLQGKKDIYTSGNRKGENKFVAKAIDLTPGLAPIAKIVRNYKKDVKYQSYK